MKYKKSKKKEHDNPMRLDKNAKRSSRCMKKKGGKGGFNVKCGKKRHLCVGVCTVRSRTETILIKEVIMSNLNYLVTSRERKNKLRQRKSKMFQYKEENYSSS